MIVYTYDGSFEGLLTAIYEAYYKKEFPGKIVANTNLQEHLLESFIFIPTDIEKSDKVYRSIRQKISFETLQKVYHVYLSEVAEAGNMIYEYLQLGFKMGSKVDLHLSDDRVLKIHKMSQRVGHEAHRMTGFVRFKLLKEGIYYAPIHTSYRILELIAPHFAHRFADQNWVIHDIDRKLAVVYNCKEWVMIDADRVEQTGYHEEELLYQALWKEFFHTIAIDGRKNIELQKKFLPKRYRKYLTEFSI